MKRRADLFQLIRAMSRSEKRYFTLDAQKSGRKTARYLELFQVINDMETYDEAALRQRFPRHLSTDKNYLYEAILRSMRDYRSANSHAARIKELMLDARYLYERGLYEQSEERLGVAKELAKEMGDHLSILEINKEEGKIAFELKRKNYKQVIDSLIEARNRELELLAEEFFYLDKCYHLMYKVIQNVEIKDVAVQRQLKEEFAIENAPKPDSVQGERRYYQASAMYYQLIGDFENVFSFYAQVLDWWDNHPRYKDDEFPRFVIDLSNFLHASFTRGEYKYVAALLERLENENPVNFYDQAILFQKTTIYKLIYYINTGQAAKIEKLEEQIEKDLLRYSVNPASTIAIACNLAMGLFVSEKFEKCAGWCEKIIKNHLNLPPRVNIQKSIHLLNLIALFEVGDIEKLDNQFRASHRFLLSVKDTQSSDYEMDIFNFIRKTVNAPVGNLPQLLRKFRAYLAGLEVNLLFGLDELMIRWIDSKLEKKSLSEIFTRRHQVKE